MEANFSNSHNTPARYIIQLHHPSFESGDPVYLSKCGNDVWTIAWDENIWKAKTFNSEKSAEREANRCRDIIVGGAQEGWTSLGYIVTEEGKHVPRFEDIAFRVIKIKLSVDEL